MAGLLSCRYGRAVVRFGIFGNVKLVADFAIGAKLAGFFQFDFRYGIVNAVNDFLS